MLAKKFKQKFSECHIISHSQERFSESGSRHLGLWEKMDQEEKPKSLEKSFIKNEESNEKIVAWDDSNSTNTRVLDRKKVYVELPAYDVNRHHRRGFVIDITSRGIGLKKVHTTIGDVIQWVVCADDHFPVERFSFVAKCVWTSIDHFNNDPLSGFQIIRISPEDSARLRKFLLFLGSRYFRDLTSHLRAEEDLRSVEEQFRSIVDSQKEMVVRFLPDAGLTFVNQTFCNFVRKNREYLIGQNFFDWTVTESDTNPKTYLSLLTPENPWIRSEFSLASPAGEIRSFEWDQKCFFNEDGTPAFYQLIGRDTTQRRQEMGLKDKLVSDLKKTNLRLCAELETLRKRFAPNPVDEDLPLRKDATTVIAPGSAVEERSPGDSRKLEDQGHNLLMVVDRANFGLASANSDGEVVYVNNYFCAVHGLTKNEVVGRNISIFHSPDQMKQVRALTAQMMKDGFFDAQEVWHLHSSGREFPMLMSGSLIKDEANETTLMATSAVDITEMKRMQEALTHSQKMEAVGTLAGGIAHDVNNALFVMTGNTDLALGEVEPGSRAAKFLNNVLNAGQRIKRMVNQILAFRGGAEDAKKPVHLTPLLKEIVKYMRGAMPPKVIIEEHISGRNDLVEVDTTQIYQLIVNLMVNARDAMMDTGGRLTVSLKNVDRIDVSQEIQENLSSEQYLVMSISDTGRGMTKEIRDRVFDPFFTTKQAGPGLGMGLSMIHMIIDNHDARIEFESTPGVGTTFYVYFRVSQPEQAISEPTSSPESRGDSQRILFVDDDPHILDMSEQLLQLMGYEVSLASTPEKALDFIRNPDERVDLVITDMTMPEMNGIELAQEIKKIHPELPIILCSGYTDIIEEDKAADFGISAVMTKPISKNELSKTIRRLMELNDK